MTLAQSVLLTLRGVLEAGVVVGLTWWGYVVAGGGAPGVLVAVLAPLVGFGFWGAVDFHRAGALAEPLRLLQELAISVLTGWLLIAVGHRFWGWALVILSAGYHALVYALDERLLDPVTTSPGGGPRDRPRRGRKDPSWTSNDEKPSPGHHP
jgi:Protein of unknown function (DUF2568)